MLKLGENHDNVPRNGWLRNALLLMLGGMLHTSCADPSVKSDAPSGGSSSSVCSAPAWPENPQPNDEIIDEQTAIHAAQTVLAKRGIPDANDWGVKIVKTMEEVGYPLTYSKLALTLAFIDQESGFKWDPGIYEDLGGKIRGKRAQYESEYPYLTRTIKKTDEGRKLLKFIDGKSARASKAQTEGELVGILHEDLTQFEAEFPLTTTALNTAIPDWRLEALSQVATFGPMQVGVLSTFSPEERAGLTWEKYAERQDLLVARPQEALEDGIRYIQELQAYYGDCVGCVIHDYKGGAFAHLNAQFQVMLREVNPDLVVDGDLLKFDPTTGVPLEEVSASESAARKFNKKYNLGYSDEEIRKALKKRGPDFVEDCFVRRVAEKYMKKHETLEPSRTTLNIKKGDGEKGETAKDQETVTEYVKKVIERYKKWMAALNAQTPTQANKPQPISRPIQTPSTATVTPPVPVSRPVEQASTATTLPVVRERRSVDREAPTVAAVPRLRQQEESTATLLQQKTERRDALVVVLKATVAKYPGCPHAVDVIPDRDGVGIFTKVMFQHGANWILFKIRENVNNENFGIKWEEMIGGKDKSRELTFKSMGGVRAWVNGWIDFQCKANQLKSIEDTP